MMYVTKLSLGRFDFDHRYTYPFWKDSSSVVFIVQLKLDGLATSLMHQWSVQGDEIGRGRLTNLLVSQSGLTNLMVSQRLDESGRKIEVGRLSQHG